MVFQQKALEKADFADKMTGPAIEGQWCRRPVLTNGKRPKRQIKPLDSINHMAQLFVILHYKWNYGLVDGFSTISKTDCFPTFSIHHNFLDKLR